jgi:serine/threonine-protein kinase
MSDRHGAAAAAAPADPLIGRTINDRFTITGVIARGGMGKVYRAEQAPLGRPCALKVLNPNYAGEADPEFHRRFFLEASIASKLAHPNTVTIFDYGRTDDDVYYMAMELLEGQTLHRAIRESGSLAEDRALHIAKQVCRSLREAHAIGVIHRDLKPANIFLVQHGDEADFVKVLDFGLVKNLNEKPDDQLTQTGLFMGSPKYMAPEQIQGNPVDARTDIYSLGIILYEMLTGKVPFDRTTSVSILMAHVNEPPPPMRQVKPDLIVSPAVEEIVMRSIAKDPNVRYSSMDDLLVAIKGAQGMALGMTGEVRPSFGQMQAFDTNQPPPVYGSAPPVLGSRPPSGTPHGGASISASATPMPLATADLSASMPHGAPVEPTGGSRLWIPFAVLGAIAIGAGAGLLAFRATSGTTPLGFGRAPATQETVAPPPVSVAPVSTTAPSATVAAPDLVKLRVTSDPEGASVREDGVEVCNATPCDLTYRGAEADTGKVHRLVVTKPGFRPETREVKLADAPVKVKLAKAPGGVVVRTPTGPATTTAAPTSSTPAGFKETPY